MISKKGYTTSKYEAPNQTFQTYKEGNSPPLNESETKKAISYLLDALSKGIPVMVGVHDGRTGGNRTDGTTDHWLVVTGSGTDAYGSFFTFAQTDTEHPLKAFQSSFKLRYIAGKGLVTDCTSAVGCVPGKIVSQVRKSKKK